MNNGNSDTEEYDSDDEYWSTVDIQRIFKVVPSRTHPNCYSFRNRGDGKIYSTIWGAMYNEKNIDLGAIEDAQIELIKKAIEKKHSKKDSEQTDLATKLRAEDEEKAFACLEKEIGKFPVHRRRSTFGGGGIYA